MFFALFRMLPVAASLDEPALALCEVCLDDVPENVMFAPPSCPHKLCHPCARDAITTQLSSRLTFAGTTTMQAPLSCLVNGRRCYSRAPTREELAPLLSGAAGADARLGALWELYTTPGALPCARGAAACPGGVAVGAPPAAPGMPPPPPQDVACNACGFAFCSAHASSHQPGRAACAVFAAAQDDAEENRASFAVVTETARACPRCATPTQRNGGCRAISCTRCGAQWCHECGRTLYWHADNLPLCICSTPMQPPGINDWNPFGGPHEVLHARVLLFPLRLLLLIAALITPSVLTLLGGFFFTLHLSLTIYSFVAFSLLLLVGTLVRFFRRGPRRFAPARSAPLSWSAAPIKWWRFLRVLASKSYAEAWSVRRGGAQPSSSPPYPPHPPHPSPNLPRTPPALLPSLCPITLSGRAFTSSCTRLISMVGLYLPLSPFVTQDCGRLWRARQPEPTGP